MTSSLRVPTYLQASTDAGGPARVAWLAALPARVDELSARWHLILDEPFEPGGNCSWVAPGIDADGRDVVLKVAWQHTEALHEAEGLAALGGARRGRASTRSTIWPTTPPRCCSSDAGRAPSCADAPRPSSTSS